MRSDRYYIDSHILYFYAAEKKDELSAEVWDILEDHGNNIYISSACVEELIFLRQTGKLGDDLWDSAEEIIDYIPNKLEFKIKWVDVGHLRMLAEIPIIRDIKDNTDHKDNTDRIAIAQAIREGVTMISSDRKFPLYRPYGLDLIFNKR
jgi:PIN domain nuclease of toxin-antitoxin system